MDARLIVAGSALVIAMVLAYLWNSERETNSRLVAQVGDLRKGLQDKTAHENLALQEKCSAQAEKMFHALGYDEQGDKNSSPSLRSHYNSDLNRCFMLLSNTSWSKGLRSLAIIT